MKLRVLLLLAIFLSGCSTLVTFSDPNSVTVDVRGRNDAMRQEAFQKADGACRQYGKVAAPTPVVHDRGILLDGGHYILQFDCVKPPTVATPPPSTTN